MNLATSRLPLGFEDLERMELCWPGFGLISHLIVLKGLLSSSDCP